MAEQEIPTPVPIQSQLQPQLREKTAAAVDNPNCRPEGTRLPPMVEQERRPKCFCETIPKVQLEAEAKMMYFKQFRTLNFWFQQGQKKKALMAFVNRVWVPLPVNEKQIYYGQYVEKLSKELTVINPRLLTPTQRRQLDYLRTEGRPGASWAKTSQKGPQCPVCSVPTTRLNPDLIRLLGIPTPAQQQPKSSLDVASPIGPKAIKRRYQPVLVPKSAASALNSNGIESDSSSILPCNCSDCVPRYTPSPPKRPRYVKPTVIKKPGKVKKIQDGVKEIPRKVKIVKECVENKLKPKPRVEKRTASVSFGQEDNQAPNRATVSPESQEFSKKRRITLEPILQPQPQATAVGPSQHDTSLPIIQVNWSPTGHAVISQIEQQENVTETNTDKDATESSAYLDRVLRSTEAEENDIFQWMLGM